MGGREEGDDSCVLFGEEVGIFLVFFFGFFLFWKIFIFLLFSFREILKQWTTHGDALVSSLLYLPENNEVIIVKIICFSKY